MVVSQSFVVANSCVTTVFLRFNNNTTQLVQFVDHVFNNISEAFVTSDIDVTQVAYGVDDQVYISPLTIFVHAAGETTLGSGVATNKLERIKRCVQRGFGLAIARTTNPNISEMFENIIVNNAVVGH